MSVEETLVRSHVDLQNYSRSGGFLGFVRRSGRFEEQLCSRAIERFHHLPWAKSTYTVLSSLHAASELGDPRLEGLSAAGLLRWIDYDALPLGGEAADALFEEFTVSRVPSAEFDLTCLAVMAIDGVRGHCFVLFEESELIAYPHDETGFGFVGWGANREALCSSVADAYAGTEFESSWRVP